MARIYKSSGDIGDFGVQHRYKDDSSYETSNYTTQSFAGSNGSDHGASRQTNYNHCSFKRMSAGNHQCEAVLYLPQDTNIAKVWNITNVGWRNNLGSDDVHVAHLLAGRNADNRALKGIRFYIDGWSGSQTGKCQYTLLGLE